MEVYLFQKSSNPLTSRLTYVNRPSDSGEYSEPRVDSAPPVEKTDEELGSSSTHLISLMGAPMTEEQEERVRSGVDRAKVMRVMNN